MKIIKPSFEFLAIPNNILQTIETAGRVCYKSEDKITDDSAEKFVKSLIKSGHHSVLEHVSISVKIVCDRGISHELVRHRLASFSQESSRYCCYTQAKFGNEITFIEPIFWKQDNMKYLLWKNQCQSAEKTYLKLIRAGAKAEEARSVLPNSLKTEIVITANLREWRYIFKLRCSKAAHPQMREVMILLLNELQNRVPIIFNNSKEV